MFLFYVLPLFSRVMTKHVFEWLRPGKTQTSSTLGCLPYSRAKPLLYRAPCSVPLLYRVTPTPQSMPLLFGVTPTQGSTPTLGSNPYLTEYATRVVLSGVGVTL